MDSNTITVRMCSRERSVTLRSLKPYLVAYRSIGLIPIQFEAREGGVSVPKWNWKRPGWRFYTFLVLLLMSASLIRGILPVFDHLVISIDSDYDAIELLQAANKSSFCLNILVILVICFCYLGRRFCFLVQRMIACERQLASFGCALQVRDWLDAYRWICRLITIYFHLYSYVGG